ncbi:MAG: redox-regulated ATPase YchF [Bacteroidales bacterium]|nr:redox-regulated ATPase YchF [Bacteroidales bacterium]MBN2698173.1 redox-regulated ATPase YchF [Bacteroidales bacterium]
MALQCGIIGIANVGKSTLFNCMSSTKVETTRFAFTSSSSNVGIVDVPDPRLYDLENFQKTDKIIPATVEIVDIPGLTKGANKGEGVGNRFLGDIRNTDALIHVVRCFDDEELPHIEGSVDPVRDIETINFELQLKDLESVEKKIERYQKLAKSGDKEIKQGLDVLVNFKEHLENFENARDIELPEKDRKFIDDLFLLTAKPVLYVCNIDDGSLTSGNPYVDQVKEFLKNDRTDVLMLAAKLESEIAELEDANDRKEFMDDAGLSEPGVNKLIRSAYSLLNLMSFFTVGPKEIRAWTIKKGMTAPQAAGVIHSDLERGFIRAEVMKYDDFVSLGSEQACREKGKLHIEGKNYVVQDGDILHIRFNV